VLFCRGNGRPSFAPINFLFRLDNLMKLTEPSTASATMATPSTAVGLLASTAAAEQLAKLHKDLTDKIASTSVSTSHVEEHNEPFI
jgi:hypothetical protein